VTEPGPGVREAKQRIRLTALAARDAMTESERLEAGHALARHGIDRWRGIGRVAAYLSFGTEPATRPLLGAFAMTGTQVVVPVVTSESLDWVTYEPGGEVAPGALGVAEPTGLRLGATAVEAVEVVLVPALAVDHTGNRLGRGRGYYDRALASVSSPVIAVVYDDELVASVPTEPHDRRVEGVLRPSGYFACL
jgi:5-formyltetrahydrofolate cyclo-ligase